MTTVGVWGLGAMGRPILEALAETDDAVGFDVSTESGAPGGARRVASVAELIERSDVVVVVLPGAAAQRRALLPTAGGSAIRMMRRGSLLLELTSGDPRLSREIAEVARESGVLYAAAPMSGGPAQARSRSLGFFVGGETDAVATAVPWLYRLGDPKDVTLVGSEPAQAQVVKLAVNAVWFGQAALVTEAVLFAAKSGVDIALMNRVLDAGAAGSAFTRDYLPRLRLGDYDESFGVDGVIEELQCVVDSADAAGAPTSTIAEVLSLHEQARDEFGSVGGELLVARLLELRARMQLRDARR